MLQRPILTARWTELLLLNFCVPGELIERLAPAGTEPDLHEGKAYVSVVGFRFHAVRLFGLAVPGHTNFPEINLRFYVRRRVGSEMRRGVVFVREIAPKRAVSYTANWLYNENYITRPMRTTLKMRGDVLGPGDSVEFAWRSSAGLDSLRRPHRGQLQKGRLQKRQPQNWNRLAAEVAGRFARPVNGSLEQFIIEHYWGYVRGRDAITREYAVTHEPWQVAPAHNVAWDCDLRATYGEPFAEYLACKPACAFVANGSAVKVYRGLVVSR